MRHVIHETRETVNAREGEPRVVCVRLRTDTPFLTFAGDREGSNLNNTRIYYAIVGTDYGWLHNTAGDVQFWKRRISAVTRLREWQK